MLDLSKSMVTCSIVGDAYENRWWYIALLVGYKATAEHYRGSGTTIYTMHELGLSTIYKPAAMVYFALIISSPVEFISEW